MVETLTTVPVGGGNAGGVRLFGKEIAPGGNVVVVVGSGVVVVGLGVVVGPEVVVVVGGGVVVVVVGAVGGGITFDRL